MGGLFGGAPKQNPNQTVTNNPPAYALPKLEEISNLAKSAYEQFIAGGYNMPYAGPRSAGQNAFDTQAINTARAGADSFLAAGAPQTTMDLSKFYSDKIFGGAYDPTQAIEAYARPITQQFTESIAPRLTSAAIDAGAYGGSKSQEFNNRAVRDLNSTLADTASRVALSYDQAEKGAAGLVPQLANTALQQTGAAADVYGNIGNTERGFAQQTINDDIARWNEQTQSPFAGLGEYLQLVSGSAPGRSQTTYGYQQPGSSFLSGLSALSGLSGMASSAGGALSNMFLSPNFIGPLAAGQSVSGLGAGLGSILSFLSDKRVKENIVFSHVEKGHRVYYFNYIWDKTRMFLGVLAQEVMKKNPKAVQKVGNLFAVDYVMLGFEMEEVA
jgi:hypothetical protein